MTGPVSLGSPRRVTGRPLFSKPSLLYRLSLGAVTVVMLLLPLVYAGLTVALVYGVYVYLTRFFLGVLGAPGQPGLVSVVLACAPLLIGWIAIIGMVRPMFARRVPVVERVKLDPKSEPALQALVLAACRELHLPAPCRIEFSCELNAAASFERGWRGFFGGRLVLMLGLPLIAGLTQRELAGIIAHELGHFRQRAGMRASFLVRSINHWFARVLAVRSTWDPLLDANRTGYGGYPFWIWMIVICSEVGTTIAESILRALMFSGHVVAAALLRQMEFDADCCEVRFAGSAAFESASQKLTTLCVAFDRVLRDTGCVWQKRRRLPDDLAGLVNHYAEEIRVGTPLAPANSAPIRQTGWLDTHPSMADRVKRARALAEPGEEISDAPAPELFVDFVERSRRVTWTFFGDEHNLPVSRKVVLAAEAWLREAQPGALAEQAPPS